MSLYSELYAQFYEATHADFKDDVGFVLRLAQQSQGPILELGCGTGRLLRPLAAAGHVVTGVDNAPAMLTLGQEKLRLAQPRVQQRVDLVQADMKRLSFGRERFDSVFVSHNTLMHFAPAQMQQVLREARRVLRPNGRLFLDLANPYALITTPDALKPIFEQRVTLPKSGTTYEQYSRNWLDEAHQIFYVSWLFNSPIAPQTLPKRFEIEVAYHYLYPKPLETLLLENEFSFVELFGNYAGANFSQSSGRLLAVALAE